MLIFIIFCTISNMSIEVLSYGNFRFLKLSGNTEKPMIKVIFLDTIYTTLCLLN